MTFQDIVQSIKDAIGDFTTIDVVTLTGNINISSSIKDNKIDLKLLYQEITNSASSAEAALEVMAFTHIDFDCDAVNFVKTGVSETEAALMDAHIAMVKTAQETRQAVISMIKETVGLMV